MICIKQYLKILRNRSAELVAMIFETSGNVPNFSPKAYLKIIESKSISEDKVKEIINL